MTFIHTGRITTSRDILNVTLLVYVFHYLQASLKKFETTAVQSEKVVRPILSYIDIVFLRLLLRQWRHPEKYLFNFV